MKRTNFRGMKCSIAQTLDLIGEWWTPLILRDIFYGVRRFEGLLTHLGISRNILTDRLQTLVENEILERRPYQSNPERFEYMLTERGIDLYPILISLMAWGDRWLPGEEGPAVELIHKECGNPATPEIVCAHCRKALTARGVRANILSEELSNQLSAVRAASGPKKK
ncbi:MAG TPA: helix-turn-helix domain-containing protein [Blastocatellia bacterium]|nr:helix-turn-helix domain-containing protein [Blastocatellia bacterium]